MKISISKLMVSIGNSCMTYKEVCSKAGISEVTLRQIKSGLRNPKPSTIGKIAKALNVSVSDLIEDAGQ